MNYGLKCKCQDAYPEFDKNCFWLVNCNVDWSWARCNEPITTLNFSWARISKACLSICPFIQLLYWFWPIHSSIPFHTVYSTYPPPGECFKIKKENISHPLLAMPKNGPKMSKNNGCSLSILVLYTVGRPIERRSQKYQKNWPAPPTCCPIKKSPPGPWMTKNGYSLSMDMPYTLHKPMEQKFQKDKKNKWRAPPSSLTQKMVHGPKQPKMILRLNISQVTIF